MNSWAFTCRIAADAELRFMNNGDPVVSFRAAVDSGFGDKKKTTWIKATGFGKRWEKVAEYLLKGTKVGIVGEATLNEWADREGATRQSLEVRINDLELLGTKPSTSTPVQNNAPSESADEFGDDIPF